MKRENIADVVFVCLVVLFTVLLAVWLGAQALRLVALIDGHKDKQKCPAAVLPQPKEPMT